MLLGLSTAFERRIRSWGGDQPTADRDFHSGLGVWYSTQACRIFACSLVFLPWMLYRLTEYATSILGHLEQYAR